MAARHEAAMARPSASGGKPTRCAVYELAPQGTQLRSLPTSAAVTATASSDGHRIKGVGAPPLPGLAGEGEDAAPAVAPVATMPPVPSDDDPLPGSAPEEIALETGAPPAGLGEPGDAALPLAAGADGGAPVTPLDVVAAFVPDEAIEPDEAVEPVVVAVVAPVAVLSVTAGPAVPGVALVCATAGAAAITKRRARQDRSMGDRSTTGLTLQTAAAPARSRLAGHERRKAPRE